MWWSRRRRQPQAPSRLQSFCATCVGCEYYVAETNRWCPCMTQCVVRQLLWLLSPATRYLVVISRCGRYSFSHSLTCDPILPLFLPYINWVSVFLFSHLAYLRGLHVLCTHIYYCSTTVRLSLAAANEPHRVSYVWLALSPTVLALALESDTCYLCIALYISTVFHYRCALREYGMCIIHE